MRHTARLPKHDRLGVYAMHKRWGRTDDEIAAFKALVKEQFDKDQDEAEARRTGRSR